MQYWAVCDNRKSPIISYKCTQCDCTRKLNNIGDRLPRICPGCGSEMSVRNYDFFTHRIQEEKK